MKKCVDPLKVEKKKNQGQQVGHKFFTPQALINQPTQI